MVNHSNQGDIQFTWQTIWWRLVVTALLLAILTGSSLTIFGHVTTNPNTQVLPDLTSGLTEQGPNLGPGLQTKR